MLRVTRTDVGGDAAVVLGRQIVGRGSRDAPSGSGEVMRTQPRLVGRRLATLAVKAGNGSSGSPNLGSVSGWMWYCRLGVSRLGSEPTKAPSWEGAMVIGPRRRKAYSSAKPARCTRLWKRSFMVLTPVHLVGAAHLQVVLQVLADAGELMHDVDAVLLQQGAGADARQLQDLRRADRAGGEDHLARRAELRCWPCWRSTRPVTRLPSSIRRSTCARVSTFRLRRPRTGRRKPLEVFQRTPVPG